MSTPIKTVKYQVKGYEYALEIYTDASFYTKKKVNPKTGRGWQAARENKWFKGEKHKSNGLFFMLKQANADKKRAD